ncbi:MAG: hypothetical protein O9246_01360, partial [Brevundimonas sp.]|nr:hypothetical protein [Brevundimonas sp.]
MHADRARLTSLMGKAWRLSLFGWLLASGFTMAGGAALAVPSPPPPSLAELADYYCIAPDGDHRMTWTRAQQDGFVSLRPEDVPQAGLPSIHDDTLRGYRRVSADGEFRIFTAATWIRSPDQGTTFYRWCWVSSSRDDRRRVDDEFQREFATRGFRVGPVRMFAWIPRPDGSLEP